MCVNQWLITCVHIRNGTPWNSKQDFSDVPNEGTCICNNGIHCCENTT
ncbi:unnamed protein product [Anisakis simplex]|uniref:WAP domain-containing protein n=1 Tax=Anisakis simplex TaxID=6269 RepID=A0A0M3JKP8_ANISI|nr:unnamed protein product [Anisakis simplex]